MVVAGINSRRNKQVRATVVSSSSARVLKGFVKRNAEAGSAGCADELPSYEGMRESRQGLMAHGRGQYVDGKIHTKGIESFWASLKRGHTGTYHKWSTKHLHR